LDKKVIGKRKEFLLAKRFSREEEKLMKFDHKTIHLIGNKTPKGLRNSQRNNGRMEET